VHLTPLASRRSAAEKQKKGDGVHADPINRPPLTGFQPRRTRFPQACFFSPLTSFLFPVTKFLPPLASFLRNLASSPAKLTANCPDSPAFCPRNPTKPWPMRRF
jgi:hypothetical protein